MAVIWLGECAVTCWGWCSAVLVQPQQRLLIWHAFSLGCSTCRVPAACICALAPTACTSHSVQWTFDNLNDEAYLRRVIMPLEVCRLGLVGL